MPSDNVTVLFGPGDASGHTSPRRAEMLATAASGFDRYVADMGVEPELTAIIFTGRGQAGHTVAFVDEEAEEDYIGLLAKASLLLQAEAFRNIAPE